MTSNPDFKVTPLFDAECLGTRYRQLILMATSLTHVLLKGVISNDLEWRSEIFNDTVDTKHGAVFLRQLSYLRSFLEGSINDVVI